ncbi:MAG: hypothetical protein ACOH1I_03945 [Gallionellaceae bacterium]
MIDNAQTAGTISEEQALIYKMYAEFGDPTLPVQYRGDDTGLIEGDAPRQVLSYINRVGLANVPSVTQDALLPFFIPAYYEGSWWHKQHPTAQTVTQQNSALQHASSVTLSSSPNCKPWSPAALCSILSDWKKVEGAHVVVWYQTQYEGTDLLSATILVKEYEDKIWPSLNALMNRTPLSDAGTGFVTSETDGRLDVLLVDMPGNSQGRTMTSNSSCKAAPTHTYLSRTLPIKGLIAQAAHEFMHSIQYSYDSKVCTNEYYTILEATAVWATNYVYPKNNWEQSYAKHYLKEHFLGKSYDDNTTPPLFRYGAYVLPLFLQKEYDANIIREIWEKTLIFSQELYAIDGALVARGSSFEKTWPKFVAANWNQETIDTYLKFDNLTDIPDVVSTNILSVSGGFNTIQQVVELPHASSAYYRVGVGSGARSLTFMNGWTFKAESKDLTGLGDTINYTGLSALERKGASLQVFLKINGVWQTKPINLTNVPWLTACHDDPAGKVEDIVFMYANAEISPAAPNYTLLKTRGQQYPGLYATNIGCRDWKGGIDMTMALPDGGSEKLKISNIVLKNSLPQSSAVPAPGGEPANYPLAAGDEISPGYGYVYAIASGDAVWTYSEHTFDGTTTCDYTGSKAFSIASTTPAHTFSHWTPPGTASGGSILTGFVGLKQLTLQYDWFCTSSSGNSSGTDITNNSLDVFTLIDDAAVRFSSSGLSLSGTGAQTGTGAPDVSGTWSFTGATN